MCLTYINYMIKYLKEEQLLKKYLQIRKYLKISTDNKIYLIPGVFF